MKKKVASKKIDKNSFGRELPAAVAACTDPHTKQHSDLEEQAQKNPTLPEELLTSDGLWRRDSVDPRSVDPCAAGDSIIVS